MAECLHCYEKSALLADCQQRLEQQTVRRQCSAAQHVTMHGTSHTKLYADPVALRRAGTQIGISNTLRLFVLAFHYIDQVLEITLHDK